MRTYTQAEIDQLIRCPKVIMDPPRKEMRLDRGSRRNDMGLASEDGKLRFSVFMRVNDAFAENFSIGLEHTPTEGSGSFCLLRYNGPHGEFQGSPTPPHAHFLHHIHRARAENVAAGRRSEAGAETADNYASFEQALRQFLQAANVTNAKDFFPDLWQQRFAFAVEDSGQ